MRRFVYQPQVKAFIYNTALGETIDISDDIVSGSVTRRLNAVSEASLVLQNKNGKYTGGYSGGDSFIKNKTGINFNPMDPIRIYLGRTKLMSSLTGYLDSAPLFQVYPGTVNLRASCTLKLLKYTYFDPGLPFMMQWFNQFGFTYDPQTGQVIDPSWNLGNLDFNGGVGELLFRALHDIGHWKKETIHIKALPKSFIGEMALVAVKDVEELDARVAETEAYLAALFGAKEASTLTSELTGDTGGGGGGNSGPPPTTDCLSAKTIDIYLKSKDSPMAGQGQNFMEIGWKYGVYAGALVGLAGQESSYGKNTSGNYNPFGYGPGYDFKNWADAIDTVADAIANGPYYFTKGKYGVNDLYLGTYCTSDCNSGVLTADIKRFCGDVNDWRWGISSSEVCSLSYDECILTLKGRIGKGLSFSHYNDRIGIQNGGGKVIRETTEAKGETVQISINILRALILISGKYDINILSMVGSHDRLTNSGNVSEHWNGYAIDIDSINSASVSNAGCKENTIGVMKLIGPISCPPVDQVICEGNGRYDSDVYNLQYNNGELAPDFYHIGDHQNHIHIGYDTDDPSPKRRSAADQGTKKPTQDASVFDNTETATKTLIAVAEGEVGVKESPLGSNSGPRVNQYLASVGLQPGNFWCASFVYWCFDQIGAGSQVPKSGGADAWEKWAKANNKWVVNLNPAQPGDVVSYENDGDPGDSDHIGIVISNSGNNFVAIGGNESDQVSKKTHTNTGVRGFIRLGLNPAKIGKPGTGIAGAGGFGGGVTGTITGTDSSALNPNDPISVKDASELALQTGFFLQQLQTTDTSLSVLLIGERALSNDIPLLEWINEMTTACGRVFCSGPEGDFYAFFPDHFGFFERTPYFKITPLEILNLTIDVSDDNLVTHVYGMGPLTGITQLNIVDDLTSVVATVRNKQTFDHFIKTGQGSNIAEDLSTVDLVGKIDPIKFLQKYGGRPRNEEFTTIRHPVILWMATWIKFLDYWAERFYCKAEFTFMPELFPGGLVNVGNYVQMFVQEVTHSFSLQDGFSTSADLIATTLLDDDLGGVEHPIRESG